MHTDVNCSTVCKSKKKLEKNNILSLENRKINYIIEYCIVTVLHHSLYTNIVKTKSHKFE